jgi:subtilisin family serine protease
MRKLDPQLEFLVEGGTAQLATTGDADATFERFGLVGAAPRTVPRAARAAKAKKARPPSPEVTVLAQYTGEPEALKKAGLNIRTVAGDVVTGTIALSAVEKLAQIAEVERVEAARAMHPDLDLSLPECRANLVHTGPPGRRGTGVIVGICDSGCDYTHPSFRRTDGTSRILFLWDQGLTPVAGETSPAGFGFGVEYTNAQINAALATPTPFTSVRHHDAGGHGTHVTGIAAGDGSAPGQSRPGGTFIGVAPEADIIVVANASNGPEGLGTSASTLDAVNYIFQRAGTLSRPCVINMSLGDNLGPHDGTSLLERGLDNLLGGPGRAFVKSAGNAGASACHAEGNLVAGSTQDVRFNQPGGDNGANQIDVWYRGGDTFRVTVIDPAGNSVGPVNVGTATTFNLPGGNSVRIDHRNNDPFNGDRRIFMTFAPGAMGTMRAGNWTIRLVSVASPTGGRFDAWIQRGNVVPGFLPPHESSARTISTPGTAMEVITAANYITRGAGVGSLASSSSRGPTRDGRAAPTVAAPGMMIMSADGESSSGDPYRLDGGTSMAAPHVTGTIALMFQKNGTQTQAQIKACLESTARTDAQTGPVPNTAWGAGKMDANAAVTCIPSPGIVRSVVVTTCPTRSVVTACISVPRTACPVVSVPAPTCPINSVPQVTCLQPSVVSPCPSVPITTCPVASVAAACPSRVCPSVVDGCPSTPGGCTVQSVACGVQSAACGVQSTACGVQSMACGVQSVACGVQSVACGVQSVACGVQSAACGPGGPGGGVVTPRPGDAAPAQLPEGWISGPESASRPQVPAQGYFEYDESWFDDDGR